MSESGGSQSATMRALVVAMAMTLPIWAGVGLMIWQDTPSLLFVGAAISVFMLVTYVMVSKS